MKKVLILAYDFPPYVSVGGLRPHYWYENFKELSLYPVVVTRNWNPIHGNELDYIQPSDTKEVVIEETDKGTLIKTPYKATLSNRLHLNKRNGFVWNILKKISTGWNEIGQWYFPIGTKYELYKAARKYLKENKVDVILATGEPFVLFRYASKLSKKFDVKWVADYRDPWSQHKNRQYNKTYHSWLKNQEIKTVNTTQFITTANDFFKEKLKVLFPKKNIHVVMNGFDEQIVENLLGIEQQRGKLTISYVGTIYDYHPWKSFLKVFSSSIEEGKDIRLNFYGIANKERKLESFILTLPHKSQQAISILPRMINPKLLEELAKDNVMLLFNYYSNIGTKVFDYLAINRKILFCFAEDKEALILKEKYYSTVKEQQLGNAPQIDLIHKTNSGIIVKDSNHLKKVLDDLFKEFQQKGYIESHTIGAEDYSRKKQTVKLVGLINTIQK